MCMCYLLFLGDSPRARDSRCSKAARSNMGLVFLWNTSQYENAASVDCPTTITRKCIWTFYLGRVAVVDFEAPTFS